MSEPQRSGASQFKDLLLEWQQVKVAQFRRRKALFGVAAAVLAIVALLEPVVFETAFVIGSLTFGLVASLLIGIALGYSTFVAYLAWSFAKNRIRFGQTKVSALQLWVLLLFSLVAAAPVASFTIRDSVDASFWVCLGFLLWTNLSCSFLGYIGAFWTEHKS